ncbi:hypothetical protein CRUP_011705 [Coryphaenoides rupestris]|nr:hypothetical protein CRUP_011705 [Coryphaenoides rupestris]
MLRLKKHNAEPAVGYPGRLAWQSCPAQGPMPPHTPNDFRVILDERVCSDLWSFKKSTSVTGPLHRLQWGALPNAYLTTKEPITAAPTLINSHHDI